MLYGHGLQQEGAVEEMGGGRWLHPACVVREELREFANGAEVVCEGKK